MPILHFTEGERFFPMSVDEYVAHSRLMKVSDSRLDSVVLSSKVSVEMLDATLPAGTYLQFVSRHDINKSRLQSLHVKRISSKSHRLTYVGIAGRLADTFFRSANIFRSLVPGGVSDAAAMKIKSMNTDNRPVVYARKTEDKNWVTLQYFYFYAMNDWRSRFSGVNDHESDWEQVTVYLDKKSLSPEWVAFASHDHHGDDLRRSWHDNEVTKEGFRPVVFVGAGSHASNFSKGEYLTSVHMSFTRVLNTFQKRFRKLARLPYQDSGFELPFIDLAHGNGKKTEGKNDFTLIELTDSMKWVHEYKGLWGLDTRDTADGERAPAGPKYNRNGTIRDSWADPVGWAGLHKVEAESQMSATARTEKINQYIDEKINDYIKEIELLNSAQTPESTAQIKAIESSIIHLKKMKVAILDAKHIKDDSVENGKDVVRSHLKNPAIPLEEDIPSRRLFLNAWALISAPLVFSLLSVAIFYPADSRWNFIFFSALTVLLIELFAKRNLVRYLLLYAYIFVLFLILAALTNIVVSQFFIGLALLLALIALLSLYWNIKDRIVLR